MTHSMASHAIQQLPSLQSVLYIIDVLSMTTQNGTSYSRRRCITQCRHLRCHCTHAPVAHAAKKKTLNMYDTAASNFQASPDGPFEDPKVHDQPTAQDHFKETREIKLIERMGMKLPVPSYL